MADLQFTQEQLDALIADEISKAKVGLYGEDELNKRVTSEVDRRVESGIQKGLETQRKKWEQEYAQKAQMTAEEIAKQEFELKLKEVGQKELEIAKKANTLEAKSMLSEAGIPKSHYDKFIGMLVSDNEDATKASVQNFIDMFNQTKTDIETKVKSEFTKVPSPTTGGQTGAITKTEFNKMGYAEKLKLKTENPELYKEFMK